MNRFDEYFVLEEVNSLDKRMFWQWLLLWIMVIISVLIMSNRIQAQEERITKLEEQVYCLENEPECFDPYD